MSGQSAVENAEPKRKQGRIARRWLIGVAAFLVVACAALVMLWQSRLPLAERLVADALTTRGISNASFQISALGFRSIEVRDLAIEPDLSARHISVVYTFGELLSGRVQSIEVDGLRVNARLDDKGLSLGAADPLLRQNGGTSSATALPAIHVSDAAIHLVTAQGAFDATGDIEVSQTDAAVPIALTLPALHLADLTTPARVAPVVLTGHLLYDGKRLSFDADGSTAPSDGAGVAFTKITGHYDLESAGASAKASGHLAFAPGQFEPKDLSPALAGLVSDLKGDVTYQADLSFADGKLTASGEVEASHASAASLPVAPVALVAHWQFDGQRLTFDADTSTSPPSGAGVALAKVTGHYDVENASASARANGQLDFAPGKLAPGDLSPTLKGIVSDLRGRVAYQGDFSYAKDRLASSGSATLSNIGFGVGSTIVSGLAGTIRLSSLTPPRTRGVQTLTVAHVETAVPLDKGTVKFEIGSGMKARLVEAAWPFTGGRLTLTSPGNAADRYKLTVDKVDIQKLLVMVDVPGLSGTGRLSGNFPLRIENGDPIITDGALSASGGGVIIYNNQAADAAASTEQTQLLTEALKDFHYTELTGAVDGNVNGNLRFQIGLRGANPSLYDGYPIHLNVNIEGSLADLIRRGTVGFRPLELIQSGVGREKEATPR